MVITSDPTIPSSYGTLQILIVALRKSNTVDIITIFVIKGTKNCFNDFKPMTRRTFFYDTLSACAH